MIMVDYGLLWIIMWLVLGYKKILRDAGNMLMVLPEHVGTTWWMSDARAMDACWVSGCASWSTKMQRREKRLSQIMTTRKEDKKTSRRIGKVVITTAKESEKDRRVIRKIMALLFLLMVLVRWSWPAMNKLCQVKNTYVLQTGSGCNQRLQYVQWDMESFPTAKKHSSHDVPCVFPRSNRHCLSDFYRDMSKSRHTLNWLVVSPPLKNICQLGCFFSIYGKI